MAESRCRHNRLSFGCRYRVPLALLTLLVTRPADAAQRWLVVPLHARGVDTSAAATFDDLLRTELAKRLKASLVPAPANLGCHDQLCAQQLAHEVKATFALFGSISALGEKIIVNVTVFDVKRRVVATSQRMSIDAVEELDKVAERIATAIAQGKDVKDTATLGTITAQEARPPRRIGTTHNVKLRVGTIQPFGDGYAGAPGPGILLDLAYWFEATHFAIEPRIGVRFDALTTEQSYGEIPIDIGGFYLLGLGSAAFFVGGGAGIRYLWETRGDVVQVGQVLTARIPRLSDDSGWGFGAYARVGLMLARSYRARFAISGEYNVTVIELNGQRNPMAFTIGISVIM